VRDHDPLRVTQFGGLFDRGDDEVVPVDHFQDCLNTIYPPRGVRTRYGTLLDKTLANIRRTYIYRIPGQAQRLLILNDTGDIYDSIDLTTVILHVDGMTDFSAVTMFGRAYISPHNGVTGLPGEKVYVYSGSGFARAAAGASPTGFNLTAANSLTSGSIEEGDHIFAVAYESDTGFITGYGGFITLSATGGKKADIANVPIGNSWVVARHIVATKTIEDFNGDFENQTYYFVPDGRIGNNTATTITVDFYDADLVEEASYLAEQLDEIPAGIAIENYNGRLVVGGEDSNQSTIRVSKVGETESINEIEGLANINPGDAGAGIKNLWVHRESLLISKAQRTYYVIDTGDEAAFWKPLPSDMSVGAEPHSVGTVLDYGQTVKDIVFVGDRDGLHLYGGTFSSTPISQKIEDVWSRINHAYFHTVEIAIDPVGAYGYCAVPLDAATSPSHILFFDYNNGLAADAVRWSVWNFPVAPVSIVVDVDVTTKRSVFKFAGYSGNVYKYDASASDDFGTAIESFIEFAFLPHEADASRQEGLYHLGGINLRIRGSGSLQITARSQDDDQTITGVPLTLTATSGIERFRLLDMLSFRSAVKLRTNLSGEYFHLTKFTQLVKWVYSELPQ
jgi:hypothetical protein